MAVPDPVPQHALKEWAVVIAALDAGQQVVLIRKGGIREETKDFRVRHDEFLLYPTYDHQQADLLKPAFRPSLARVLEHGTDPRQAVTITHFARVAGTLQTDSEAVLRALSPYHVFADEYAEKRLHWRPKKPLDVLLVRVFRLEAPVHLPVLPAYGGCKSWIELASDVDVATERMTPVLDDATFARMARGVRGLFSAPLAG